MGGGSRSHRALIGLAALAALAAAALDGEEGLPAGRGRTLLLEACVQCHDLRPLTSQRKDAAAWRRTVNEMVWRGAPLLPGEADELARYLAASFPRSAPERAAAPGASPAESHRASRDLPPGPGRGLVLKACIGCHDLATTTLQRKTAEEWRRSVDLMVRLGARLDGGELPVVVDYLARALPPAKGRPRPGETR